MYEHANLYDLYSPRTPLSVLLKLQLKIMPWCGIMSIFGLLIIRYIYIAGVTLCLFKSARMLIVLGANSSI